MTDQYFTLVFRGSIRDFKEPLKTETVFGVPFAAGVGDAFAETEQLEAQLVSDIRAETEIERLEARIEMLEAELREIRDLPRVSYAAAAQVMAEIARVALAPEQRHTTPEATDRKDWPKDGFINDYD